VCEGEEGIWQGVREKERSDEGMVGREGSIQAKIRDRASDRVVEEVAWRCVRGRKEEMAKKVKMMRAILWDMAVLLEIGFTGFGFFVIFKFCF